MSEQEDTFVVADHTSVFLKEQLGDDYDVDDFSQDITSLLATSYTSNKEAYQQKLKVIECKHNTELKIALDLNTAEQQVVENITSNFQYFDDNRGKLNNILMEPFDEQSIPIPHRYHQQAVLHVKCIEDILNHAKDYLESSLTTFTVPTAVKELEDPIAMIGSDLESFEEVLHSSAKHL